MHVHAFSPLEIDQGAKTLGLSLERYLRLLREAGLDSLPGTAAEVLDEDVRAILCPDKVTSHRWLEIMESAHEVGLFSTATIMFGHVDSAPRGSLTGSGSSSYKIARAGFPKWCRCPL